MEDQNIEGKDRETSALSKKSLRQHIRQRKARHTDEELVALSQPIVEAVQADPRFQEAQTVLLYHSLPDEVYTPGLIAAALRMGKRVLLPVVISRTEMEIREYLPTTEMALSDDFHILEPQGAAFTDYASVDCAIIPGMAFDAQGHRLGRGRGYYDRFLAQAADVYKVGLCSPSSWSRPCPAKPPTWRWTAWSAALCSRSAPVLRKALSRRHIIKKPPDLRSFEQRSGGLLFSLSSAPLPKPRAFVAPGGSLRIS